MTRPFVRLVLISLVVVSWIFLSLFGLRFLGSMQSFQPLSHKLMFQPSPPFSISESAQDSRLQTYNLFISKDQKWVAIKPSRLNDNTDQSIALTPLSELKDSFGAVELTTMDFSNIKNLALVIRAEHNAPLFALHKYIQSFPQLNESVLILTDYPGVVRELKKLAPRWLYSSTPPTLVKIELFSSLLIENLADYPFDLLVVDVDESGKPNVSEKIIREAERRHIKIISRGPSPLLTQFYSPGRLYALWQTAALSQ